MYFRELKQHYTSRAWYIALRSLLTLLLGVFLLIAPRTTLDGLLPAIGIALFLDGGLIALPILMGKTTRHLWKVVLLREVVQILVGLLLIFNQAMGFDVLAFLLGGLLLFRGVVQLILFVEVHTTVWHRRGLLLTTLLFFTLSAIIFFNIINQSIFFITLLGCYLVFEGITRALAAYRLQDTVQSVMHYEQTVLSSRLENPASLEDAFPKPQPRQERSFLLPHLNPAKYKKIMILTPHPDDLEGFVGGLAYRLTGEIVSVIFAGGDKGVWSKQDKVMDTGDYIRVRLEESAEAARLLGVREIIYMGYLDRGVPIDENAVNKTLEQLALHQPDLVVSFEYNKRATPYPHPDHLATADVVRQAVARYQATDDLDYMVVSTLLPNRFIDVTGVRRIKLEALACHSTQTDLNTLIFPFFEKLLSRLWGIFAGVDYAEGYRQIDIPTMRSKLGISRD